MNPSQIRTILVHFISGIVLSIVFCSCVRHRSGQTDHHMDRIRDADGNNYNIITIGNQQWLKENLKVTRFRNGDPVVFPGNDPDWMKTTMGAGCYHNNDPKAGKIYGVLYNWSAANDTRGICPEGWHIPSDEEWQQLADFLGGDKIAGNKIKESGSAHWAVPNEGATNESGFTALPGGGRDELGKFIIDQYGGFWWSSTEDGDTDVWVRSTFYGYGSILRDSYPKNCGFSVRCLRDSSN